MIFIEEYLFVVVILPSYDFLCFIFNQHLILAIFRVGEDNNKQIARMLLNISSTYNFVIDRYVLVDL